MFPDTCRYEQFCLLWYVEIVSKICPRPSVTFCIYFSLIQHVLLVLTAFYFIYYKKTKRC
jgi:hypothetical protein